MSTYEVLARLMEDMLYLQPIEIRLAKGGIQSGRNNGQMKLSKASIAHFHLSVFIVPQLADQQAAARLLST
jgi:hypothetical protein